MTTHASTQIIKQFSDFVNKEMGLFFPENKFRDLERGVRAASQHFKFDNVDDCMLTLMSKELTQKQIEVLASFLTIGETYFFRDPTMHQVLKEDILPSLIASRSQAGRMLRIWSAGCATGEEPFSIAITLLRTIPNIKQWNISIIASDINTNSLKKLQEGQYTDWSFRGVSEETKKEYFTQTSKNTYVLQDNVKEMVEPMYINLCKDSYPSLLNKTNAIDILLCRNVLMYFSSDIIHTIIDKFYHCLAEGGYFIVSPSEYIADYVKKFKIEVINGMTVYRKPAASYEYEALPTLRLPVIDVAIMTEPLEVFQDIQEMQDIQEIKEIAQITEADLKQEVMNLADQGQLDSALSLIDRILSDDKTNIEMYYLKAMILVELKKHDQAIKSLNQVLYLDHDYAPAYIVLGNIFHQQGKKAESKSHFECALSILKKKDQKELLPDSAGMTVERVMQIVQSAMELSD